MLKPGGYLAAFGSPRTFHRLACGLEDAELDVRDTLCWLYGTGMPKSHKLPGGQATTLKPAWEPILLARRPVEGTAVDNIERYGTGALNIDARRIDGRHPANVLLAHAAACAPTACAPDCAATQLDEAAAATRMPAAGTRRASRIFYAAKASRFERDAGCERLPALEHDLFPNARGKTPRARTARNPHPTVKPLALMRWLVGLVCPPGGLVLDPFCGSGTTGCAALLEDRRFLGIEIDPGFTKVAAARITHWSRNGVDRGPFDRRHGRTQ